MHLQELQNIDNEEFCIKCLVILPDCRIVSGSSQGNLIIYNIINNEYKCELIIQTNHDLINYLMVLETRQLLSCGGSKEIRVWSIFQTSYTFDYGIKEAHEDFISKIISLSNNRIASCSKDKTIRIWKSQLPFSLIKILKVLIYYYLGHLIIHFVYET